MNTNPAHVIDSKIGLRISNLISATCMQSGMATLVPISNMIVASHIGSNTIVLTMTDVTVTRPTCTTHTQCTATMTTAQGTTRATIVALGVMTHVRELTMHGIDVIDLMKHKSVSTHSYQHERHMESEHTTVQRASPTSSSDIHHSALGDYSMGSSMPTTSRTPPPSTTNATPTVLSQPYTKEDDEPENPTPTERAACAAPSPSCAYRRHSSDISPTQTLSYQSPLYVALPPVVLGILCRQDPQDNSQISTVCSLTTWCPYQSADKNSNTCNITKPDDDSCFLDQDRRVSTPRDHSL